MFARYYYHGIFRKSIIAFGTLFNDIMIKRTNNSGEVLESLKVPVQYGPIQKFLAMIAAEPGATRPSSQLTLPRISFEIKGMEYDGGRKLPPTNLSRTIPADEDQPEDGTRVQYSQFLPVPYNLQVELAVMAKTQSDGLQIIEQILPNFHPSLNVSIQVIEETKEERDIAVVLNTVAYEDRYEGVINETRALVWTLNFTVKTYLFGPVDIQKDIRKVTVDYRTDIVRRTAEVRYTAEVESTDDPPIPRDQIDPETDNYKVVEKYEDNLSPTYAEDQDFFGLS